MKATPERCVNQRAVSTGERDRDDVPVCDAAGQATGCTSHSFINVLNPWALPAGICLPLFFSASVALSTSHSCCPSTGGARSRCPQATPPIPPINPPPTLPDTLEQLFNVGLSTTTASSSTPLSSFLLASHFLQFSPGLVSSLVSPAVPNGPVVTSSTIRRNPSDDCPLSNVDPPSLALSKPAMRRGELPTPMTTTPTSHTSPSCAAKAPANSPSLPIAGPGRVSFRNPPLF